MSTAWTIKEYPPQLKAVAEGLSFSSIGLQLFWSRGFEFPETIEHFLNADASHLADPFRLPGMDAATTRIFEAVKAGQRIMIHGDYDVDGITASAIMVRALKKLGASFMTYIPHRKDGYGFTQAGVAFASEHKVRLILTLDCGITSAGEVAEAKRRGIDTVIVDHHQIPSQGAPECAAIVNPWLDPNTNNDFIELSAAGLAFKLASALLGDDAVAWIDLAAVGTVADVAPLTGENRIIVKSGLRRLSERKHIGIAALMQEASEKAKVVTARHIGFVIGPRLNAGGRVDSADNALKLLISDDKSETERLAGMLEERNRERRAIQNQMIKEAFRQCELEFNFNRDRVIVLWNERWHPGVIGIVAARLVDQYYRPAIVMSVQDGKGKGSCRSIRHFHMHQALGSCSDLLLEYGGHEAAAGFSIDARHLNAFRSAINEYAKSILEPGQLMRPIDIDAEISLSDISEALVRDVMSMAPFGSGNPEPTFLSRGLRVKDAPRPRGAYALGFCVTDGKQVFQATAKKPLAQAILDEEVFDMAYTITIDIWEGRETITLRVRDAKQANL